MIHYFLEVSIAWTLFYLIYFVFLRRETFFDINRWYLLHTLWIGAVLPFLRKIPIDLTTTESIIMEPVTYISYSTLAISQSVSTSVDNNSVDLNSVMGLMYIAGIVFFSFKLVVGLLRIRKLFNRGDKKKLEDVTLVISQDYHMPFSFLNYIFLHESFLERDTIQDILNHEMTHVKKRHTYDVLFLELMSILFWWNPIIYLYKKSLRQAHEYVADAYAAQYTHIKNYGHILLGQCSSGIELALTHQFFNSHLKKRITMLYKKKSAKYQMSRYLLVLPLFIFLCILYSFQSKDNMNNNSLTAENKLDDSFAGIISQSPQRNVISDIPYDEIIDELSKDDSKAQNLLLKSVYSHIQEDTDNADQVIKTVEEEFLSRGYVIRLINDRNTFLEIAIPYELSEKLNKATAREVFHHKRKPFQCIDENSVLYHYSELSREFPFYKSAIKNRFEKSGTWYGNDIVISDSGDRDLCVGSSPIKEMRMLISNPNNVLRVGETYNIKVLNLDSKDPNITVVVPEAFGEYDIPESDDEDGHFLFSFTPTKHTEIGESIPINVSNKVDVVSMEFTILKSQLHIIMEEAKSKTREFININNGGEMTYFEGDTVTIINGVTKVIKNEKVVKAHNITEDNFNSIDSTKKPINLDPDTQYSERHFYIDEMTDPLIVINGEISDSDAEHYFSGNTTESVIALDRQKGTVKYGSHGSNGVLEFQTSKFSKPKLTSNVDDQEIYKVVQDMPRFPGCEDVLDLEARKQCAEKALIDYVYQNIKYPKAAKEAGVSGKVYLQFIVRKDGTITDSKVVRDIGEGCGEVARKVVQDMPVWTPGKQKGKPVDVMFTLPVKFYLPENERWEVGQNDPNPFSEDTVVEFNLATNNDVKFSIIGVNGNEVYSQLIKGNKGINEFTISNEMLNNNYGVNYYEIKSLSNPSLATTKKMIFNSPKDEVQDLPNTTEVKVNENEFHPKNINDIIGIVIDGEVVPFKVEDKTTTYSQNSRSYYIPKKNLDVQVEGTEKFKTLSFVFTKEGQELEYSMPISIEILGNPVQDNILNFKYRSKYEGEVVVHITDMLGRPAAHENYSMNGNVINKSINLSQHAPGAYSITVFQNGMHTSKRFVVQ